MIHFDEVKKLVLDYVDEKKERGNEYYIIRDVYGKISVYIVGEKQIEELKNGLCEKVGQSWVGQVRVIDKNDVIFKEIENSTYAVCEGVYYGERPLVKKSWDGEKNVGNHGKAKVITFYSYKGGVGRTTTLALTALQIAREGKKIVVIDLDLEAPGLSTLLKQEQGVEYPKYGVVDYLVECEKYNEYLDLNDYIYPIGNKNLLGMAGGELLVMQAANLIDSDYENYYTKLSRLDFNMPKFINQDNPISRLLNNINRQYEPDYIFIDSRAGIHDIGGLALLNYSDEVVALFYGNEQNMLGMKFVLPRLARVDVPFYLINTPVPVLEEAAEEEMACYLKNSFEILCQSDYFSEIPDMFDESSPHYPLNISYDAVAANVNSDLKLVQLITKDGENNIYKKIAKMLTTDREDRAIEDFLGDIDKRKILDSVQDIINFDTASAENEFNSFESLKKNFYPLKEYKNIFDNNKFIITGSKGSGKTALFKVLNCQEYAQALAEYVEIPKNEIQSTEWLIGLDSKDGFPTKANFRAIGKTENREYYSIYWKILAIRTLKNVIAQLNVGCTEYLKQISECKYSEIIEFIETHKNLDEQLSELFIEVDRGLRYNNKIVIITYDALDFCLEREYRGDLISELISFWAENNLRLKNLKTKIFLRNDIFKNEVHLTDKIKLNNYRTTIEWDYDYLLAMVWKRMMEASPQLKNILKRSLEFKGYSLQEFPTVGIVPKPSEEINKIMMNELVGEKMGKGNKAYTYNWIVYRLSDTKDNIVPRSILKLFSTAAKNEILEMESPSREYSRILRPRSLEGAMQDVSEDRVTDMSEEYEEYKTVFYDLKNYCTNFPVEESTLREALIKCGLKEENLKSDIDKLIDIGVLKEYQRKKSDPIRYHIPDIYLKGMRLTRKGYK